jgi:flagellar assembly protein FliH
MSSPNAVAMLTLPELGGGGLARPGAADGPLTLPELTPSGSTGVARSPTDEAYERGVAEGRRQAEAGVEGRTRSALDALAAAATQVEAAAAAFAQDRERNLTALALAVAHRLVDRFVAADPHVVADLVTRALELMPGEHPLEVRLHPADLAAVRPALDELAARSDAPPWLWRSDPSLGRGDVMVDGPQLLVDGRTDTALRTLYERLAGV